MNNTISLNFLEISPKQFDVVFYAKELDSIKKEDHGHFFKQNIKINVQNEISKKYAIVFNECNNFDRNVFLNKNNLNITKQYIYNLIKDIFDEQNIELFRTSKDMYKRLYLPLKKHIEGTETIWIEPYYLPCKNTFGLLIDFKFFANVEYEKQIRGTVDRKILQLSGSLDARGYSNKDFYLFRNRKIKQFLDKYYPLISSFVKNDTKFSISGHLAEINYNLLKNKIYLMSEERESKSTYLGLQDFGPLQLPSVKPRFLFVFREDDRDFAAALLRGLRGSTYSSTFRGIESVFRISFENSVIQGKKVRDYSNQVFAEIIQDIINDRNTNGNIIPIIITDSKMTDKDDELYYKIKYLFTQKAIPCQIVTKALIGNTVSLKYSLCNIALQIFAKIGGKPWKVKTENIGGLIIGIGDKHKKNLYIDEMGIRRIKIEKYLTYSVLTDSSGLFKEIQILSETDNEDDYYKTLIERLSRIINQATIEGYKNIVIHSPFRISKSKVLDAVFNSTQKHITITVLVINSNHKFFGFDSSKNSLLPYESTFISLSSSEYLIWFEGLQYNKSSTTNLIGAPVYINFWYSNKSELLDDASYRKDCLQDCINLSGANWRGFKAKQLPISIFYCNTIAEFLKKFEDYELLDIKFEDLKPWFL
jgi:hypothetical protein